MQALLKRFGIFLIVITIFLLGLVLIKNNNKIAHAQNVGAWAHVGLNGLAVYGLGIDPTDENIVYAGGAGIGLWKTVDGGANWVAINNGIVDPTDVHARGINVDPNNPNILYAGSESGTTPQIYKSVDGGANWTTSSNGIPYPRVADMQIDPTNSAVLYVGIYGNCMEIWKSIDSGANWSFSGGGLNCDITRVKIDPVDHNRIYATGNNFYKSNNAGATWTAIAGVGFPRGIVIDPTDNNIIYLGQFNGMIKSVDGGQTWTTLPISVQIDKAMVLDPLDHNTIYAGSYGNGMFVSHNGGASWDSMNAGSTPSYVYTLYIPPTNPNKIYAATTNGVYVYLIDRSAFPTQTPTPTLSPTPTPTPIPQLSSVSPAKVWIGQDTNGSGVKYDLKAEIYKNANLVTTGQVNSVDAGGRNFSGAILDTIPFNAFTPVDFPIGSSLTLKLYARNACVGSKNNGKEAILWFNDAGANSGFGATIGGIESNFYLINPSNLSIQLGVGPRKSKEADTESKCSSFKQFGTWSITP